MTDTSNEAVDRLAQSVFSSNEMSLMLRALAAERDALNVEVEYLRRWHKAAFLVHPNIDLDMESDPDARAALQAQEAP